MSTPGLLREHHVPPVGVDEVVMYLVVRTDLYMSSGKLGVQIGHGVQAALKLAKEAADFAFWDEGSSTKIALGVGSHTELLDVFTKADGLAALVADEGRTEIEPTDTVVAFVPMLKSRAQKFVGGLKLYKSPERELAKKAILRLLSERDRLGRELADSRYCAPPPDYDDVPVEVLVEQCRILFEIGLKHLSGSEISAIFNVAPSVAAKAYRRLLGIPEPEPTPAPLPVARPEPDKPFRVLTDEQLAKMPVHNLLRLMKKVRASGCDDEYFERIKLAASKLPHKDAPKKVKKAPQGRLPSGPRTSRDEKAKQTAER